jgi:hypothetical protein
MCSGATKAAVEGAGRGKSKELKMAETELGTAERE